LSLKQWNARYRAGEQLFETPTPLVVEFAGSLTPGLALDLAAGPGRNALYLAERGWRVTAVDGSPVGLELLLARASAKNLEIDTHLADLEREEFTIQPAAYDLICDSYYLQRSLIEPMKAGLRPGGTLIAIVHLGDPDQPQGTPTRAYQGELRAYFTGWTVLHYREGRPNESCHQRAVAELVARKPS
jgi:tellurite methyltransferase